MMAFASVAVLAAAANFIVERSVSIVTGSNVTQAPPAPVVEEAAPPPPAPVAERRDPVDILSADELMLAIERFDDSVYSAVQSNSVEALARYNQFSKEVDRTVTRFTGRAEELGVGAYKSVPAAIRIHKRDAGRWIELAERRRTLLREYSETLERMNGRVNASLDGAFKIFGRVVARQSLVQLNGSLDGIRDNFAAAVRTWSTTAETFDSLSNAEAEFDKVLRENAKTLQRAEGQEWFAAMEKDFVALTQQRTELIDTQRDLVNIGNGFVAQTTKLMGRLPKDLVVKKQPQGSTAQPSIARAGALGSDVSNRQTQPATARDEQPGSDAERVTAARAEQSRDVTAEDAQAEETTAADAASIAADEAELRAAMESETTDRSLVAWISVAVLALLLWISIATVRSVVRPVRSLIDASKKIAAGEPSAPVGRGGIKELDSLAVAFNDMAERLANAQLAALDVHHQLEAKVAERTRQLQELAELDPLTGLPNRRHLFSLLNASIERASQASRRVGVLFLDVDNFKNINDSIGHSFGDRVLRGIAQRLQSAVEPLGFAARLGGDEFTIVCEHVSTLEDLTAAGDQIIRAFQSPIDVDGRELIIGVSVGASVFPDHEQNAESLLIAADTALFHAKSLGRGRVSVFTPELLAGTATKFRIEQDLRRAIERDEFELFFQPEVSIEDLQTQLVEALIRWRTPDGRYVPPGEFLSVAEESGLIVEISDWVLRTAVRTAAEWHRGAWPQARVAVNVSPRQLLDYRFVDRLRELLAEFNLPARCIEIELTESVLQTGPATIEQLHRLRALGVAIALDDFGTGYSSLSSLERLPLTRVKLDRSLIESIDTNVRSRSIVRAIIDMCNGLDLQVTAEGLERAEQFERFLGCKNLSVQGYLLSRPVSMDQAFAAMASAAQRAQELVLLSKPNAVASVIKQLPVATSRSISA